MGTDAFGTAVRAYVRMLYHVLRWRNYIRRHRREEDVPPFTLSLAEAEIAGLRYATELLWGRGASANPATYAHWRRCILGAWFDEPNGHGQFVQTGDLVPSDWKLREIHFHPMPDCLPAMNLVRALRREAVTAGLPARFRVFEFHGHRIESATYLADVLINRRSDHDDFAAALDEWQYEAFRCDTTVIQPTEHPESIMVKISDSADGMCVEEAVAIDRTGAESGKLDAPSSSRDRSAMRLLAMAVGNGNSFSMEEAIESLGEFPVERHHHDAQSVLTRKNQENRARLVIKRLNYLLAHSLGWQTQGKGKRNPFSANGSGIWSTRLDLSCMSELADQESIPA